MGTSRVCDGAAREVAAKRRSGAGRRVTEDQLFDALCENLGVLACAALSLGLTLASLVQRVARSRRLRAGLNGARSVMIGYANERLQGAVSAGEAWALQFLARAGKQTAVPADAGKPVEMLSFSVHRVAQPVAQGEPRPDLAEALSRRLVVALDRGEPWAVMYCLTHLDPAGPFFAKCRRGWQHDLWAEQLAAAPMVTESAADVGDINGLLRAVDWAGDVPEENGDAEPRLMVDADAGLDGSVAAPPVCAGGVDFSPSASCRQLMAASAEADATEPDCIAPPVCVRGVDFSPQPDYRRGLAASAEADATKAGCIAPPICVSQFERRLRLPAGGSGVGCANFKTGGLINRLDRLSIAPFLKLERPTPVAAAPPVSARGVDFSPRPDCWQFMSASAEADATEAACIAPPISGDQFESRLRLPAGESGAAPPVSTCSVDFSPQPGCRLVMAASAEADATEGACIAPPVSARGVDFSPRPDCWQFMRASAEADATTAACIAPPVCAGRVDFSPQPGCRLVIAASAQADATKAACIAPPVCGRGVNLGLRPDCPRLPDKSRISNLRSQISEYFRATLCNA